MKRISIFVAVLVAPVFATTLGAQETDESQQASIPRAVTVEPVKKDPEATAEKVTQALADAKDVPAKDIAVSSHAGIIVLTGEVNSEAEGARATKAAESVADGARVSTDLEVRPIEERPAEQQQAAQLVRDVQQALKSDRQTANLGVVVTSEKEGVVVLQGLIPSAENRTAAQSVASRVAGVKRVESRMVIPGE